MKDIVILCNGSFPRKAYPLSLMDRADVLVCCDGALGQLARRCVECSVTEDSGKRRGLRLPDAVVGDLDSISPSLRKKFSGITVHDPDQQTNDLTKAMKVTLERFCGDDGAAIHILGASGKREDHTIGNLSLLMEYEKMFDLSARGISVEMVSDWSTAFAVTDSCSFYCGHGRSISLFCNDSTVRIHSDGLEWPLDDVVFDNWWKGTLNRSDKDKVTLSLSHPAPLLIILS